MHAARHMLMWLLAGALLAPIPTLAQDAAAESAKTWIGRAEEIEAFLESAEVIELKDIGTGVTNPMNQRTVYVKVIGNLSDRAYEDNVKVVLSPMAAKLLGAVDQRFYVKVTYCK